MLFRTSIIIPTYNRPGELTACIQSIIEQSVRPDELLIIDDGQLDALPLKNECEKLDITYIYHRKDTRGLTLSRNIGVSLASGNIIYFLDDDVVLFKEYIEEILKVYQSDAVHSVGGVGGIIVNHRPLSLTDKARRILEIFFLISGFEEGKVLPSGFCVNYGSTVFPINKQRQVDFLPGGVSSYRKEIFKEVLFNTARYRNYGLGEDQDFSYQVSKKHKLIISPAAKLFHNESPSMRPDKMNRGRMFVLNRYFFFKEHIKKGQWSWALFYYSLVGYIIIRTIALIISPSKNNFKYLMGVFKAVYQIFNGDSHLGETQ